jgi:hypothetical protein
MTEISAVNLSRSRALGAAFLSSLTQAQKPQSQTPPAEPVIDPIKLIAIDYGLLEKQRQILDTALEIVAENQPQTSNFFNWRDDKSKFNNTKFALHVIISKDIPEKIKKELRQSNGGVFKGDAFTAFLSNQDQNQNEIHVYVLYDRIFFDESGHERKDGFARLATVLGHEFYGTVQSYAERIATKTVGAPYDRLV